MSIITTIYNQIRTFLFPEELPFKSPDKQNQWKPVFDEVIEELKETMYMDDEHLRDNYLILLRTRVLSVLDFWDLCSSPVILTEDEVLEEREYALCKIREQLSEGEMTLSLDEKRWLTERENVIENLIVDVERNIGTLGIILTTRNYGTSTEFNNHNYIDMFLKGINGNLNRYTRPLYIRRMKGFLNTKGLRFKSLWHFISNPRKFKTNYSDLDIFSLIQRNQTDQYYQFYIPQIVVENPLITKPPYYSYVPRFEFHKKQHLIRRHLV